MPTNNKKKKSDEVEKRQSLLTYKLKFRTRNKNLSGIDEECLITVFSNNNDPYGWENTVNIFVLKEKRRGKRRYRLRVLKHWHDLAKKGNI